MRVTSTLRMAAISACVMQKKKYDQHTAERYCCPSAMTPGSRVKQPSTCRGKAAHTTVNSSPSSSEKPMPMDTTRRMLPTSRRPQYWAASSRMLPSIPALSTCSTVWIWVPR